MKKRISVLLVLTMLIMMIYPCGSIVKQKVNQNSAVLTAQDIARMTAEYNEEYEYRLDKSGAESITVDNRLIVETKSKINTYDAIDEVYGLGYAFIQFEDSASAENALAEYEEQGLVVSNDRVYNLNASSYSTYADDTKWAFSFTESDTTVKFFKYKQLSDVTVGIIDSGIDYTHTLLKSRALRTNTNFSNSGNANDEMDDHGHGTKCAGIIAQTTTDNVKIQSFKAGSDDGKVYTSSLICTYEYILNMTDKPDIINMSFGGNGTALPVETTLLKELKESGIVLVASAGNENLDTADSSPANDENVLAVSAFDQNGEKCSFSNYGTTVDISAPGIGIYTTDLGGGYTNSFGGTSASAPFVSAAAAIVLMQNNTLTPDEVYTKIKSAAFNTNKPSDRLWSGAGLLNYFNLIDAERKNPVTFNYESGEYEDTIKIELSCADGLNTKIIYTTDNTLPSTTNGTTYKNAIEVDSYATIIAAAFPIVGSSLHSQYTSASYQIFKVADENDFELDEYNDIIAYNGKYAAIKVPDTINGVVPVGIGKECFMNSDIVHIELPDSIESIGMSAFENSNLQKIKALGVKRCYDKVFKNCSALYEENMPNINYLSSEAFYNCRLLTKISFAQSLVTAGGANDSPGCLAATGITEADFPNLTCCTRAFEDTPIKYANLPQIKLLNGGFRNCRQLTDVNLPLVTRIAYWAFGNCVSLPREMDFSQIIWVESYGFAESLFDNIELPNCEMFYYRAFFDVAAKTISLPKCTELNGDTFKGDYLEYVNFENLEDVPRTYGSAMFMDCYSLKCIYAPKANRIPSYAFDGEGELEIKNGAVPQLKFIYAPQATECPGDYLDVSLCPLLEFIYAPNLKSINSYFMGTVKFPSRKDFTLYLTNRQVSGEPTSLCTDYTVVAPNGSYAEKWVKDKQEVCNVNFVSSNNLYFSGADGEYCYYTEHGSGECVKMPIYILDLIWNDEVINQSPSDDTCNFLLDFTNDGIINAKDYAELYKLKNKTV
ncbi:MAG: S8 family serine peptidase [Eubacterium sp.]|nr:S8 family serine peptidase [Eubacterium sp.]